MIRSLTGGQMEGASFTIGSGRDEVLCVGYASALSIRSALSAMHLPARVTCCFSAENVEVVAARRRNAVIFADNDKPVADFARRTGLRWVMPPEAGMDANAYHRSAGLPALQRLLLDLLKGTASAIAYSRAAGR